jgi:hypothetical protein
MARTFLAALLLTAFVDGADRENLFAGDRETLEAAYRSACDQARAVGMLASATGRIARN